MAAKVSVVIPAYNAERYIAQTLRSVFEQTYAPYEVIVVDDGSTDGTGRVVAQMGDRVRYERQANQGASAARNRGVELAQGEWIAFLDADDAWYPNRLEVQLDYAASNPQVGFIYSDFALVDEGGRVLEKDALRKRWEAERSKRNPKLDLTVLAFYDQPFPYPSTVLMAKELLVKAGGFNLSFRANYHEDFEAFARVARLSPPHFIAQSLVKYRRPAKPPRGPSVEHNYRLLLHCLQEIWRDDPEKVHAVRHHLASFYGKKGRSYLCSGQYQIAREYFKLALSYDGSNTHVRRRWLISYLPGIRDFYAFWQVRVRGKEVVYQVGEIPPP